MPSGDELKAFLRERGLRRKDAAAALHVSKDAFDRFCLPNDSPGHREMEHGLWELLLVKLGLHTPERLDLPARPTIRPARKLDARTEEAVRLRNDGKTLAAIGRRMGGLSRQRVHQLLRRAAQPAAAG